MKNILLLHGPNLNLLGLREPMLYGQMTLADLNDQLFNHAQQAGIRLHSLQSNSESSLIAAIHEAKAQNIDYILFNPAAFTHTSIALRDALLAVDIPFIEIHISNIYARESFRHHSYFSDIAQGIITGLGTQGYFLALDAVINRFN